MCSGLRRLIPVIVVATLIGACSSGASGGESSSRTLTYGSTLSAPTLDPGNLTGNTFYAVLAYDSLIDQAPDGSLKPGLAESWKYVGEGNKVFELKLRKDVKFSDGSPLTAEVVKGNLDRYRTSASLAAASQLKSVETVTAVDALTVRLTLSTPDPVLPTRLSESYSAGTVVSADALKDPKKLVNQTFGAGPYMIDPAETVADDHYTYKPNPHYWNKDAIHYDKVVMKVLPNPNAGLAALKTKQVDVFGGEPQLDRAAKTAGLQVIAVPQTWVGLALADRTGKVLPPLRDVRVRQALNYAIDRQQIANGLVGTYGGPVPTEQIVLPGQVGHNDRDVYNYDPNKAKQLLREAGYPNGFTLPVVSHSGTTPLLEVMADQYNAIGVRMEITDRGSNQDKYGQDLQSAKFPAFGMNFGTHPSLLLAAGPHMFQPEGAFFNPFRSSDPQLTSLYQQTAAAAPAEREQLERQIVSRLVELAWFVPVLFKPVSFYARPEVSGVVATEGRPIPNPVEWHPKQ